MSSACFIPIKTNSERVPGKNFRIICGKKLYEYIIENAIKAEVFDDIYIDTNSQEIKNYLVEKECKVIERVPELAQRTANGNDLIVHRYNVFPQYDFYFQLFATAPFLSPRSIKECFEMLTLSEEYDSCFTVKEHYGFFWINDNPVNYRPNILPRSQDLTPMFEETTGLYGISGDSIKRYKCRIGRKPYMYLVNEIEAIDINTEYDFAIAEIVGKNIIEDGELSYEVLG